MGKRIGLSKLEMREQIRRINRLDLSRSEYSTIKDIIAHMIPGVPIVVGTTLPQELFFRARKSPGKKLTKVAELCAPPPDKVVSFQRCNPPGEPMFYCSSRRITALIESEVKQGDIVYLSQWIGKKPLPVNKTLDASEDIKFDDHLDERSNMFHAFIDTLFTKKIQKTFSTDYKLTSAISEQLTSQFTAEENRDIREDGRVGIRYPSVVDIENSYNTAFPPSFALERIDLLHVIEIHIIERQGNEVSVSLADTAMDFADGEIQWTGKMSSIPAPRNEKGGVFFRYSGTKWNVLTTEHLPVDPTFADALLNELLKE